MIFFLENIASEMEEGRQYFPIGEVTKEQKDWLLKEGFRLEEWENDGKKTLWSISQDTLNALARRAADEGPEKFSANCPIM